ncbi:hypothetical protein P152DRAFT_482603 [Eremomyces bilateralis CBS 781.70]|uniref:Uncharacterized protein n=1 Tax=Eremomyces bilateralis CBS 781.70 TaxID=1392243 RepID=A0A6G1G2M7_9PEZI|nr:uncharacterized protein P152DRAFT_482603 [Eremomyces bilateralis CBS 781.70]KAF1812059.1 hypothetical protein P152DRAFT_482603 [Eremomyces bilateralis CBS 781.70]
MVTSIPRVRSSTRRVSIDYTRYPHAYRYASWCAAGYSPTCTDRRPGESSRSSNSKSTTYQGHPTYPASSTPRLRRCETRSFHGWGGRRWPPEDHDARYERLREEMSRRRKHMMKEHSDAIEQLKKRIQEDPYDALFGWSNRVRRGENRQPNSKEKDQAQAAAELRDGSDMVGEQKVEVIIEPGTIELRSAEFEYDPISNRMVAKEAQNLQMEVDEPVSEAKSIGTELPPETIDVDATTSKPVLLKDEPLAEEELASRPIEGIVAPISPEEIKAPEKPEPRLNMPEDDLDFLQSSDVRASMSLASEANYRSDAEREQERLELKDDYRELQQTTTNEEVTRPTLPSAPTATTIPQPLETSLDRVNTDAVSTQRIKRLDRILKHLDIMTSDMFRQQKHIDSMQRAMDGDRPQVTLEQIGLGERGSAEKAEVSEAGKRKSHRAALLNTSLEEEVDHVKAAMAKLEQRAELSVNEPSQTPEVDTLDPNVVTQQKSVVTEDGMLENQIRTIYEGEYGLIASDEPQKLAASESAPFELDHETKGTLQDLVGRASQIEARLDALFNAVKLVPISQDSEAETTSSLDALAQRVSAVDSRLGSIISAIDQLTAEAEHDQSLDGLVQRVSAVDSRIDGIISAIDQLTAESEHEKSLDGIVHRVSAVDSRLDGIISAIDQLPAKVEQGKAPISTSPDPHTKAALDDITERLFQLTTKIDTVSSSITHLQSINHDANSDTNQLATQTEATLQHLNALINDLDTRFATLAATISERPSQQNSDPSAAPTTATETAARLQDFVTQLEAMDINFRKFRWHDLSRFVEIREQLIALNSVVNPESKGERGGQGDRGRPFRLEGGWRIKVLLALMGAATVGNLVVTKRGLEGQWRGLEAERRLAGLEEMVMGNGRGAELELVPVRPSGKDIVRTGQQAESSGGSWFWSR